MTWVDDYCMTCRTDADRHPWCERIRDFVCGGCGHDDEGCDQ